MPLSELSCYTSGFPFFSITRCLNSILHCPLVLDATQAHCQPLSSEWLTLAFLGFSGISCTFLYFTSQAIMYFPLLQFAFSCVHNDNSNTPDPFWGTSHCSAESFARFQHTNAFFIPVFRPLTQCCTKLTDLIVVLFLPFAKQLFPESPPSSAPSSGWHLVQHSQN